MIGGEPRPDHTFRQHQRGPIPHVDSGRGPFPWIWEMRPDPGWVYTYAKGIEGHFSIRCCSRCLQDVTGIDHATGRIGWEADPPDPEARCPRCERPFGDRPPREPGR